MEFKYERYFRNEGELLKVFDILGYEVFIPKSFYNPISFLRRGCMIWILIGDNNYNVYECSNENTLYLSLVDAIKSFPQRNGFYCEPLNADLIHNHNLHIRIDDYCELSAACLNENDSIKAMVLIKENEEMTIIKGVRCVSISCIINEDDNALETLYRHFLGFYYTRKYRGILLSYETNTPTEIHNANLLNMTLLDDGLYYYQFE